MSEFSKERFELLFNKDWPTTKLAEKIHRTSRDALFDEYEALKHCAPQRWTLGKTYFVEDHDGCLTTSGDSNRFEERLAIALWRKNILWPRPRGGEFRMLDYQVPLQARRSESGIGKIDLLGMSDGGRLMVIELKVKPKGSRGNSPMAALMQGLRYVAITDANLACIANEATKRFGAKIERKPPIIQLLAPKAWWLGWCGLSGLTRKVAGNWETEFAQLIGDIESRLDIVVECIAFDDLKLSDMDTGVDGNRPQLNRDLSLFPVCPEAIEVIGLALPPCRTRE